MSNQISTHELHTLPVSLPNRSIGQIAAEIKKDWLRVPKCVECYLNAMFALTDKQSKFGLDAASDIVNRFLANAQTWKGATARRLKSELKNTIK